MYSSPKIHDLSSPTNDWRQETNETQNYALLARELHTKYTFARKQQQQQQQKRKKLKFFLSDEKKKFLTTPFFSPYKRFKVQWQTQINPIGAGLHPTHNDKDNEWSSDIPPLGLYVDVQTKIR